MREGGETELPERKGDKIREYLQKGELSLKHALGLGAQKSVIPITAPKTNGPPRPVRVGWHPVGGLAGKWFAEQTGLGKMITEKIHKYPDPTQHWAVLVGDYAHQLWMDENLDIIYINGRIDPKEWNTFPVGETCFNDYALMRTGEALIQTIRETRSKYNLITNNCQTYVTQLLDAVEVSKVKEFPTTLAVYQRLFSSGKVIDLFAETPTDANLSGSAGEIAVAPSGQELGVIGGTGTVSGYSYPGDNRPAGDNSHGNSVLLAQQVMDANTNQVNTEEESQRHMDDKDHKHGRLSEASKSLFRKFKK